MNNKGIISEMWSAVRVNLHGKIDTLTSGFNLEEKPFSVFILPTSGSDSVVIVPVRLLGETTISDCPIVVGDWCPLSIVEIDSSAASLLSDYDIYWGRGY